MCFELGFQSWLVVGNARCEQTMHWCYSGSNGRVLLALPFIRDYECNWDYLSSVLDSAISWTNFLGTIEHFEGSLLSWEEHWGQPNVHPSLAWWIEVRSISFLLQKDNFSFSGFCTLMHFLMSVVLICLGVCLVTLCTWVLTLLIVGVFFM
jgi:hypothetical protein